MTNLEKIQSKNVEEMAGFLTVGGFDCGMCRENGSCDCDCFEHCKEWLEQEAEEDD